MERRRGGVGCGWGRKPATCHGRGENDSACKGDGPACRFRGTLRNARVFAGQHRHLARLGGSHRNIVAHHTTRKGTIHTRNPSSRPSCAAWAACTGPTRIPASPRPGRRTSNTSWQRAKRTTQACAPRDRATRARFASDLRNLTLASPRVNRHQKSGKGRRRVAAGAQSLLVRCPHRGSALRLRSHYRPP